MSDEVSSVHVTFKPPTDAIYKLEIVSSSREHRASLVLIGAKTTASATLPAGRYRAHLTSLGTNISTTAVADVDLHGARQTLNLRDYFDPDWISATGQGGVHAPTEFAPSVARATSAMSRRLQVCLSERDSTDQESPWRPIEYADTRCTQFSARSVTWAIHTFARAPTNELSTRLQVLIDDVPVYYALVPMFRAGVRAIVTLADAPDQSPTLRFEALDAKVQSMVAALSELPLSYAKPVLEWAAAGPIDSVVEQFVSKQQDIWAATAASLLLARSNNAKGQAGWIYNLADRSPHICDAGVAAAWARASDGGDPELMERETLNYLVRARQASKPTFRATYSLALELLTALQTPSDNEQLGSKDAAAELTLWSRLGDTRLPSKPYALWGPPEPSPHRTAGADTSQIVSQLSLTADGFAYGDHAQQAQQLVVMPSTDMRARAAKIEWTKVLAGAQRPGNRHVVEHLVASIVAANPDRVWTELKDLADKTLTMRDQMGATVAEFARQLFGKSGWQVDIREPGASLAGLDENVSVVVRYPAVVVFRTDSPRDVLYLAINDNHYSQLAALGVRSGADRAKVLQELDLAGSI